MIAGPGQEPIPVITRTNVQRRKEERLKSGNIPEGEALPGDTRLRALEGDRARGKLAGEGITSEEGNGLLKEREYLKRDMGEKRKWTQNSLQGAKK